MTFLSKTFVFFATFAFFFSGNLNAAEKIKFAFLAPDSINPSNAAIYNGARGALKKLESRFGKEFEIIYISADLSATKQAKQLSNLYIENFKGAIVYAVSAQDADLQAKIAELKKHNFFIISVGENVAGSFANVSTDRDKMAKLLEDTIEKFKGSKKINTFCYFYTRAPEHKLKISDEKELTKLLEPNFTYSQFKEIFAPLAPKKIVAMDYYSVYAKANAVEILRYDNYGEIFFSPYLLANISPIKKDTDRIFAICIGALPQFEYLLSNSMLDVCIYDDFYGWGYFGVRALLEKYFGVNEADIEKSRLLAPLVATPQSLSQFSKDWVNWLN